MKKLGCAQILDKCHYALLIALWSTFLDFTPHKINKYYVCKDEDDVISRHAISRGLRTKNPSCDDATRLRVTVDPVSSGCHDPARLCVAPGEPTARAHEPARCTSTRSVERRRCRTEGATAIDRERPAPPATVQSWHAHGR